MTDRTCIGCGVPVSKHSRTCRCRSCSAKHNRADPEMNARRQAALSAKQKTPEMRAKYRAGRLALIEKRKDDPQWQEYLRAQGQRLYRDFCQHPDALKRRCAAAAKAATRRAERNMAWCPPERRADYQKFRKQVGAAEARRIIEAEMTPFERQLARVRSGAALVPTFKPRRADHDFTLGGVAPEVM